jgi:hypothetical protein
MGVIQYISYLSFCNCFLLEKLIITQLAELKLSLPCSQEPVYPEPFESSPHLDPLFL